MFAACFAANTKWPDVLGGGSVFLFLRRSVLDMPLLPDITAPTLSGPAWARRFSPQATASVAGGDQARPTVRVAASSHRRGWAERLKAKLYLELESDGTAHFYDACHTPAFVSTPCVPTPSIQTVQSDDSYDRT